jgi:hypothetical protein
MIKAEVALCQLHAMAKEQGILYQVLSRPFMLADLERWKKVSG